MRNVYHDAAYAAVVARVKADLQRLGAPYGDTEG